MGSKDFAGAQAISQAYGQALENKDYDITFKDNLGATEIVYKALENGDLDGYADYQGTLLTYLGGTPDRRFGRDLPGAHRRSSTGTDITVEQAGARGRRERLLRHQGDREEVQAQEACRTSPRSSSELTFGGPAECEERPLCLGTTSQQLYGLDFSEVKKLDIGGPITVQALEDGDIDVALLFTGSSVIPKDAVLLTDDKELQPADNPVFVAQPRTRPPRRP